MPPIGTGTRLGPYEITGLLGAGGMGQVFRARDTRLGRDVAVKVLVPDAATDPDRRARFDREARAIAALSHPHICTIHDVGVESGVDYVVLELLEGESLAARLRRGPVPLDEALARGIEIASALDRAHRAGVVHRDLKPGNVMLTPSGAKVLDFGLARITRGDTDTPAFAAGHITAPVTEAGVVLGTVQYMAPEQIEGRLVDGRADVFAFGATLYEMVTGRRAFNASSTAGLIGAIVRGETPSVLTVAPGLPASLDRIVRTCLEKDPARRFSSLHDVALALEWLREDVKRGGPRAESADGAIEGSSRSRYAVAGLATLAAAGLAAVWILAPSTPEPSPVSFVIGPPAGVEWTDLPPEPMPSVSPDGRRIAFTGLSAQGRGVWVRDLSSVQARSVPGSTDSGGPLGGLFWSADSTRVGYCAGGRLKLHTLDERPPTLLDADCVGGPASATAGGEILYRGRDGLRVIGERGGAPQPATTVDASRQEVHNFPRWLPGDRRFVFTAIGPDPGRAGIFVGSLDGAPPTRILADVSKSDFVVSPGGTWNLVFVRGRNLVVQPIDKTSLAPAGEARTLAESISIGNAAFPSFSASTMLLVYRSRSDAPMPEWAWFDRRGAPSGARPGGLKGASAVASSPDGSLLLYTPSAGGFNSGGIWMLDAARRVERPLQGVPQTAFQPSFSRDGQRIAFATIEPGSRRLHVMPFPDGPPTELATAPTLGLIGPEWSADGSTLVGADNAGRIVAIHLDAPQRVMTLVPNGNQPQLSPDGRWLAYTSTISGTPEVYVQRFPEGTEQQRVSLNGGAQPRWRRDGKELYYSTTDSTIMSLSVRAGDQFETGPPSRLFREPLLRTDTTSFDFSYLPSSDGQRFLLRLPPEGRIPITAVTSWLAP